MRSYKHLLEHEMCSNKDGPSAPIIEQLRTPAEHAVLDAGEDGPDDNWDDLGPEGVTNRVATFLACLRPRSSQTFSSVNYVVQETSSLIHDIVTDLKNKTKSVFQRLGQEDLPEVKVLREEFNIASEPFKDLKSHVKQIKYFTQSGNFILPVEEVFPGVSYMSQRALDTGVVRQVAVQVTFQRVPLRPNFAENS